MLRFFLIIILATFITSKAVASTDIAQFNRLFTEWTTAFNNKNIQGSCKLFSKSVIANYQGVKPKDYNTICNGFKKIFQDESKQYHYDFKLHQVYRSLDLAAVRITWFLKIYQNKKLISETQDEGIDIFKKNSAGEWEIVEYLAYPIPSRDR